MGILCYKHPDPAMVARASWYMAAMATVFQVAWYEALFIFPINDKVAAMEKDFSKPGDQMLDEKDQKRLDDLIQSWQLRQSVRAALPFMRLMAVVDMLDGDVGDTLGARDQLYYALKRIVCKYEDSKQQSPFPRGCWTVTMLYMERHVDEQTRATSPALNMPTLMERVMQLKCVDYVDAGAYLRSMFREDLLLQDQEITGSETAVAQSEPIWKGPFRQTLAFSESPLSSAPSSWQWKPNSRANDILVHYHTLIALLCVKKEIYNEAKPLFYANHFVFGSMPAFDKFLRKQSQTRLANIADPSQTAIYFTPPIASLRERTIDYPSQGKVVAKHAFRSLARANTLKNLNIRFDKTHWTRYHQDGKPKYKSPRQYDGLRELCDSLVGMAEFRKLEMVGNCEDAAK
ncbi:hypothetical protein B0A48_17474 [Cryoendolithus antarcticus]|uniref:Uncharacterized protein n=1 Tax=Cryoendolithus antarcticus TaxID=1507870 RepID=A0A1V8SDA3_9PEZI|nr:hypothetical protein B0A48_17474 [Cryoendolithus antarcticus]